MPHLPTAILAMFFSYPSFSQGSAHELEGNDILLHPQLHLPGGDWCTGGHGNVFSGKYENRRMVWILIFGKYGNGTSFCFGFHQTENQVGNCCFHPLKKTEKYRGFILSMQVLMVINYCFDAAVVGRLRVCSKQWWGFGFWLECPPIYLFFEYIRPVCEPTHLLVTYSRSI